jgi:ribonuclease P protein component
MTTEPESTSPNQSISAVRANVSNSGANRDKPRSFRFPKRARLLTGADFTRVYQQKTYAADAILVVQAARNDEACCRLGLSVSKQVGNAVVRARWKRLIREAFRLSQYELPADLDLIVRPRRGATAEFAAVRQSLLALVQQIDRRLRRPPQATKNKHSERRDS